VAIFVINEWLPEDSSGANGRDAQRQAFAVIAMLAKSNHQIVVVEQSPFEQKFYGLCKNKTDLVIQGIARAYMKDLRWNLDRCLILSAREIVPLTESLAHATKMDDHYLVQAQLKVEGAVLVTTDCALCQAVSQAGLKCISREEFLQTYL
jgi:hypothetical protein